MTQTRLDLKPGGSKLDVTVNAGGSIGTSAVRVSFDTANVSNKERVLLALAEVRNRIVQSSWPVQSGVQTDVILLAGQSNMSGRGTYDSLIDTTDANVNQFDGWVDSGTYRTVLLAQDRLKHPELTALLPGQVLVGPGMFFAKAYEAATGRKVLLVPAAWGGTSLVSGVTTWSPYGSNNRDYLNAIDQANRAITASGGTFAGILWFQGEGDGASNVTGPAYMSALVDMIAGLRAGITGASSAPLVASHLVPEAVSNQGGTYAQVDASLSAVADITKCAIIAGVSGHSSDNLHYDAVGARLCGTNMYGAWATAVANAGASQPGAVTSLATGTATATSMPLTWAAPSGGGIVRDYQVQFSLAGAGTWADFNDGFNTTASATVTSLTPSTSYDFRVRANNYGATPNGAWSSTATASTTASSLTDAFPRMTHITGTHVAESGNGTTGWIYGSTTGSGFTTDSAGTSSLKMPSGVDGSLRMAIPTLTPVGTDTWILGLLLANTDPNFSAGASGYKFGIILHGSLVYRAIVDGAASSVAGNINASVAVQSADIMRLSRSSGVIKAQVARSGTPTTWIDIHQFVATSTADLYGALCVANTTGSTQTPGPVIGNGWA